MSENEIEAEGVASISRMLGNHGKVHVLNLSKNPLQDEGGIALAEALKANVGLYDLDCSQCRLGSTAGDAIGEALKYNTVLGKLNLSGTKIGSKGVHRWRFGFEMCRHVRMTFAFIAISDRELVAISNGSISSFLATFACNIKFLE